MKPPKTKTTFRPVFNFGLVFTLWQQAHYPKPPGWIHVAPLNYHVTKSSVVQKICLKSLPVFDDRQQSSDFFIFWRKPWLEEQNNVTYLEHSTRSFRLSWCENAQLTTREVHRKFGKQGINHNKRITLDRAFIYRRATVIKGDNALKYF